MVIPKTTNTGRILENLKSTEVSLDDSDLTKMRSLDRNQRFFTGDFLLVPGQTEEQLWDSAEDETFVTA